VALSGSQVRWDAAKVRNGWGPQGQLSELARVKRASGGGETPPASRWGNLREDEAQEGIDRRKCLTAFPRGTDSRTEQDPEGGKGEGRQLLGSLHSRPRFSPFLGGECARLREKRQEGNSRVTSLRACSGGENPVGRTPRALPRRKARKVGGGVNRREAAKA
jgi:hypothetical protein